MRKLSLWWYFFNLCTAAWDYIQYLPQARDAVSIILVTTASAANSVAPVGEKFTTHPVWTDVV